MKTLVGVIALAFVFMFPTSVFANPVSEVLGDSTVQQEVTFPTVTSGPGFILPDSPLYSLDKFYQRVRLALIFTADNRARLHNQIAGERLAELRVMMNRSSIEGVDSALFELSHESLAAANELKDASAQGRNTKQLANDINETLRRHQNVLYDVASQLSETSIGEKIYTSANSVRDAQLLVVGVLPVEAQENEIAQVIEDELDRTVLGVSTQSQKLEKRLTTFERNASRSAEKRAEKELKEKNKTVKKEIKSKYQLEREKVLEQKKAQLKKLQEQRKKQVEEVRKVVKEAQAAAKKLQEARKEELKALREQREIESSDASSQ